MPARTHSNDRPISVLLCVAEDRATVLSRMLEGELGWHASRESDPLMPADVVLADGTVPLSGGAAQLPLLAVVAEHATAAETAELITALGARAWVPWPTEKTGLAAAIGGLISGGADTAAHGIVRVCGAAGGVGTTTVTLALAGLFAWSGKQVLAVVDDRAGARGPVVDAHDIFGPSIVDVAQPVAALPAMRVVRRRGVMVDTPMSPPLGIDLVVIDCGLASDQFDAPDVLVARRDRAGAEAVAVAASPIVAVLDEGPLPWKHLTPPSGRMIKLAKQARVAKSNAAMRTPIGLPGTWLKELGRAVARPTQRQMPTGPSPASKTAVQSDASSVQSEPSVQVSAPRMNPAGTEAHYDVQVAAQVDGTDFSTGQTSTRAA